MTWGRDCANAKGERSRLSFSSFQRSRATLAGMIVREILSLAEDSKAVGHHYDYQDY
jgi:hypothetical protein